MGNAWLQLTFKTIFGIQRNSKVWTHLRAKTTSRFLHPDHTNLHSEPERRRTELVSEKVWPSQVQVLLVCFQKSRQDCRAEPKQKRWCVGMFGRLLCAVRQMAHICSIARTIRNCFAAKLCSNLNWCTQLLTQKMFLTVPAQKVRVGPHTVGWQHFTKSEDCWCVGRQRQKCKSLVGSVSAVRLMAAYHHRYKWARAQNRERESTQSAGCPRACKFTISHQQPPKKSGFSKHSAFHLFLKIKTAIFYVFFIICTESQRMPNHTNLWHSKMSTIIYYMWKRFWKLSTTQWKITEKGTTTHILQQYCVCTGARKPKSRTGKRGNTRK